MSEDLNLNTGSFGSYNFSPEMLESFNEYAETLTAGLHDGISHYENIDETGFLGFNPLNYSMKTLIALEADHPLLPGPDDGGSLGQDDSELKKFIIKQEFGRNVQDEIAKLGLSNQDSELLYLSLMDPDNPHIQLKLFFNPKLLSVKQNIHDKALAQTKQECHLPNSWTPNSQIETDWIPQPPAPYTGDKRQEINSSYTQTLKQLLEDYPDNAELSFFDKSMLEQAIVSGDPSSLSDNLKVIFQDLQQLATDITQVKYGLPLTWEPGTADLSDWIPNTPAPYDSSQQYEINNFYSTTMTQFLEDYIASADPPITPSAQAEMRAAAKSGNVPGHLKELFALLKNAATITTQAKYGLPATWTANTTDIKQWVPINLEPLSFRNIETVRFNSFLGNAALLIDDYGAVLEELVTSLPSDHPQLAGIIGEGTISDYLKIITSAIQLAKSMLNKLQIADAELSRVNVQAKFDLSEANRANEAERLEKSREKQKAGPFALVMKILGPVVSALMTIVAVAIAVASLGTATAAAVGMIAAAVVIGTIMTSYSIADSVANVTSKLVEAFSAALSKIGGPSWVQNLVKALIIIVIVAVLIVIIAAMVMTGNGSTLGTAAARVTTSIATSLATSVARQTSMTFMGQIFLQQIIKAGVTEVVKQVALQAALFLVMSTNAIPDLVASIMEAAGCSQKDIMIARMVTMGVTMIFCMALMLKVMGATTSAAKEAADDVAQAATDVTRSITQRSQTFIASVRQQIEEGFDGTLKLCEDIIDNVASLPSKIKEELKSILRAYKDAWQDPSGRGKLGILGAAVQIFPSTMGVVASSVRASMLMEVRRQMEAIGELEAAQELLMALIQVLEQLLANLQGGMDIREQDILDLNKEFMKIYNAASQSFSGLANSINAGSAA